MMGISVPDVNSPVLKSTNAVLALTEKESKLPKTTACIRCGRCVSACPEFLVPQKLFKAAEKHDIELFKKLNGMECVECGSCAWICPARKPLTQAFKQMRVAVRMAAAKK